MGVCGLPFCFKELLYCDMAKKKEPAKAAPQKRKPAKLSYDKAWELHNEGLHDEEIGKRYGLDFKEVRKIRLKG